MLYEGKVSIIEHPKGSNSIPEYIHNQCNIKYNTAIDTLHIEKELRDCGDILFFIRGKYLLWFLVEFVLNIHKDINKFSASIKSSPKIHVGLSQLNGNVLIAPRSRLPQSLRTVLQSTYGKFIQKF